MNNNGTLSVCVEAALTKIRQDAHINSNDAAILIAAILLASMPILLSLAHLSPFRGDFLDVGRVNSALLLLVIPLIIIIRVFKRINKNRTMLSLYENDSKPCLVLDKSGMTVPIIILPSSTWRSDYCNNPPFLRVQWSEIVAWDSSYISEDIYSGEKGMAVFDICTLTTGLIKLDRSHLHDKEEEIIRFASDFVKLPLDVLKHDRKENLEVWIHRLTVSGKGGSPYCGSRSRDNLAD